MSNEPPSIPLIHIRPKVYTDAIRFHWLPPAQDGGLAYTYELSSLEDPSGPYTIPSTSRSYSVNGLSSGTLYTYSIKAVNIHGDSPVATYRSVYVGPEPPAPTTAPVAVKINSNTAVITNFYESGLGLYNIRWAITKTNILSGSGTSYKNGIFFGNNSFVINNRHLPNNLDLTNNMYTFDAIYINDSGYSDPRATNPIGNVQYTRTNPSTTYPYIGSAFTSLAYSTNIGLVIACAKTGGSIWTSTDEGANWVERTGFGTGNWISLAFDANCTIIIAADQGGSIWTSGNLGVTWIERPAAGPSPQTWSYVAVSENGTYALASATGPDIAGGYIYLSSDSGATWTQTQAPQSNGWSSLTVSNDGQTLYATQSTPTTGTIYKSTNGGDDWNALNPLPLGGSWKKIYVGIEDPTKIIILNSQIHLSSDSGASWTALAAGTRNWTSIHVADNFVRITATTDGGYIHFSQDSGATWDEATGTGGKAWTSIVGDIFGQYFIAVVNNGSIWRGQDTNPGQVWYTNTNPGTGSWVGMAISRDGLIMVAGATTPYISIDGGLNWRQIPPLFAAGTCSKFSISISDSLIALAINQPDYDNYIYTSNNVGVSWVQQVESGLKKWSGIASDSYGNTLYAQEVDGKIYKSVNAGVNWEPIFEDDKDWNGIACDSLGTYVVAVEGASAAGPIWTSDDSGETWTERMGSSNQQTWSGIASDSTGKYLVACVSGGSIWTSSDYGVTWTEQTAAGTRDWRTVTCSTYGNNIIAGVNSGSGSLWASSDFGVTWAEQVGSGTGNWTSVASSANARTIIATDAGPSGNTAIVIGKIN